MMSSASVMELHPDAEIVLHLKPGDPATARFLMAYNASPPASDFVLDEFIVFWRPSMSIAVVWTWAAHDGCVLGRLELGLLWFLNLLRQADIPIPPTVLK